MIFHYVPYPLTRLRFRYRYMISWPDLSQKKVAESICERVDEIHKSTGAVDEDKGHLIRVWVTLVITLPLCRGRLMTLVNSTKSWVSF